MELRLAFTEFLFAFCAVVLADRVHGFSERVLVALGWARPASEAQKPALTDGLACDWYVHFYRSDLTGDRRPSRTTPGAPCRTVLSPPKSVRRDSRPRLRA